ncbi:hypothetical protein MRX96_011997 [Rhipicephalus microplus]
MFHDVTTRVLLSCGKNRDTPLDLAVFASGHGLVLVVLGCPGAYRNPIDEQCRDGGNRRIRRSPYSDQSDKAKQQKQEFAGPLESCLDTKITLVSRKQGASGSENAACAHAPSVAVSPPPSRGYPLVWARAVGKGSRRCRPDASALRRPGLYEESVQTGTKRKEEARPL